MTKGMEERQDRVSIEGRAAAAHARLAWLLVGDRSTPCP